MYLRDQAEVIKAALAEWDHETTIATLTAPGADVLPWDTSLCKIDGPHKHSGPNGCRVNEWDAAQWNRTANKRLAALTDTARVRTKRAGLQPPEILGRVLELKRGVFHAHVILGFTWGSRTGLEHFLDQLDDRRGQYGFGTSKAGGFDRGEPGKFTGAHAGLYSSKYLRPDGAKGSFIPALILIEQLQERDPETGRPMHHFRPVYVNRKLTQKSGVTLRFLRWSRYAFVMWKSLPERQELVAIFRLVRAFPGTELIAVGPLLPHPPPAEAIPF